MAKKLAKGKASGRIGVVTIQKQTGKKKAGAKAASVKTKK